MRTKNDIKLQPGTRANAIFFKLGMEYRSDISPVWMSLSCKFPDVIWVQDGFDTGTKRMKEWKRESGIVKATLPIHPKVNLFPTLFLFSARLTRSNLPSAPKDHVPHALVLEAAPRILPWGSSSSARIDRGKLYRSERKTEGFVRGERGIFDILGSVVRTREIVSFRGLREYCECLMDGKWKCGLVLAFYGREGWG